VPLIRIDDKTSAVAHWFFGSKGGLPRGASSRSIVAFIQTTSRDWLEDKSSRCHQEALRAECSPRRGFVWVARTFTSVLMLTRCSFESALVTLADRRIPYIPVSVMPKFAPTFPGPIAVFLPQL
jgi:hypothetical protein